MRIAQCPIADLLRGVSWVGPGVNEVSAADFSLPCCQLFSQRTASALSQERKPTESYSDYPSAKICVRTYVTF